MGASPILQVLISVYNDKAEDRGLRRFEFCIMIIKEGTLESLQGDKTNIVTTGGIIFEASNELHGVRNIGTNRATYFVFRITLHG